MKINSKRGLSLVALLITILVMFVLASVVVLSSKNSVDNANVTDFMSDLQKIEDSVESYYIENGIYPSSKELISQTQVLEQVGEEKRAYLREEMELNDDYNEDGSTSYYVLDLAKIDVTQTKRGTEKDEDINDVYIISESTGNVYYLKGLETKDNTYFSITEKAVKLYSVNEPLKDDDKTIDDGETKVIFNYKIGIDDIVTGNDLKYKIIENGTKYGELPTPTRSHQYEVTYDENGGTLDTLNDENKFGTEKYTFLGWYLDTTYSNEITETSVLNITNEHYLYAKWKKSNDAYVILPNITRDNYNFDAWYTTENDVVAGKIGEKYKIQSDTTLIAKWDPIGFTLTINPGMEKVVGIVNSTKNITAPKATFEIAYDGQGGVPSRNSDSVVRPFEYWTLVGKGSINSPELETVTYTFGDSNATLTANYSEYSQEITLPDSTKEGYTFDGWYTKPESGVLVGKAFETYKANQSIKLYAQYTKNATYKVEHYLENANDDNYVLSQTEQLEGPIGRVVYAKNLDFEGFKFDDSIIGTISLGTVTSDGELTLKLYYSREKYNLTLTSIGGSGSANTPGLYKHGQTVEITANPNFGYEFKKWTTADNVIIKEPESATTTFVMPKKNITITANFIANGHILTVKPSYQNYSGEYGDSINVEAPVEKYQVTLKYENDNKDEILESNKIFESWSLEGTGKIDFSTSNPVTYTFADTNDTLTANYSIEGSQIKLPKPSKTGSTFLGWYTYISDSETTYLSKIVSASDYDENDEYLYTPTSDIELYAVYTPITYNLEVLPSEQNYSGEYNAVIDINVPESEKYVVECNSNGGNFGTYVVNEYDEEGNILNSYEETSYYKVLESFEILDHWDLEGGGEIVATTDSVLTYRFGTQDAILTAVYSGKFSSVILPEPNAPEGYTFEGWYTDEDFIQKVGMPGDEFTPESDITLYAKWEANAYKLNVMPGNNEYTGEYLTTTQITVPESLAYIITLEPNGGILEEKTINSYKKISSWTKEGPGTIENKNEEGYYFTFGAGDATLTANYIDEAKEVFLPSPEKEGYTFVGWYSDTNLENLAVKANKGYIPTENITLYAKYVEGVARIGDIIYLTLEDAINAVPDDGTKTTIEILTDIDNEEKSCTISEGKNVEIDLAGYTISSRTDTIVVYKGNLSLYDGAIITYKGTVLANADVNGTVVLNNVTVNVLESGTYGLVNVGSATVKNSNFMTNTDSSSIAIDNPNHEGKLYLDSVEIYCVKGTAISNKGGCYISNSNISNSYLSDGSDSLSSQVIYNTDTKGTNNSGMIIYNGSVTSNSQVPAIVNENSGTLTIGKDTLSLPDIHGGDYGIKNDSTSTFYFKAGEVYGNTNAIDGKVTSIRDGYKLTTERDSENVEKAYLTEIGKYTLTVDSTIGGTVSGAGKKEADTSVTVIATPITDYEFIGWYNEENILISTNASYTFTMPENDLTLKAVFQSNKVYFTDISSPSYMLSNNNTNLYTGGGDLKFKLPSKGYEIKISTPSSGRAKLYIKNKGEDSFTLIKSINSNEELSYVTTDEYEVQISGIYDLEFEMQNGNLATIVNDLPVFTINLYSPDKNTLYKSLQVKKFSKVDLDSQVDVPQKAGYDFLGWSTEPNSNVGFTSSYITQDLDLYAIWEIQTLYLEPNIGGNYSIVDANTYVGNMGETTFVRLRANPPTYSLSATLTDLNSTINMYTSANWSNGISVSKIASGNTTINSKILYYSEDMYVGFSHSMTDVKFNVGSKTAPLKHILDGFESDGMVLNLDGRYSSGGILYSSSVSSWYNVSGNGGNVAYPSDLTRGGNYFTFNGKSSKVKVGFIEHNDYKNSFTLETVFKSTKTVAERTKEEDIVDNFENGGIGIVINSSSKITGQAYIDGAYRKVTAKNVYNNELTKASLTYDGKNLCLYINGVLEDSLSITGEVKKPNNGVNMYIGANEDFSSTNSSLSYTSYFKGNIYSVMLYNKALNASGIKENYEISKIHIYGLN